MFISGMSLNTVSLFGIILAIGIVVDDAILVVESTQVNIDKGMKPQEATRATMRAVTGSCHRNHPGAHGGLYPRFVHARPDRHYVSAVFHHHCPVCSVVFW